MIFELTRPIVRYPSPGLLLRYPDLFLKQGEMVGLAGESGCGKSSLFEALLSPAFTGTFSYGCCNYQGTAFAQQQERLFQEISYCPQYAQAALNPKLKLKRQIELCRKNNPRSCSPSDVSAMLTHLGLAPDLPERYPAQLSGGEKQRFVVLLCLLKRPKLLFMDEPSSAIDILTLEQITRFLLRLKGQLSLLMISHDLEVLRKLCDRVILLQQAAKEPPREDFHA